ncbi:nicotinate-nucleotide pyrophosphorylase [carboxylating] isoform X1 [Amblyraja radiata]|uniref:nicotinate-nucleotide pyrophosphorylase [carboxylating] isoform X1 n=2 Tax=Amblyraja radiata TaxID=386614 RepID=UPI001402BCA2|nr:nicotinate-nucleotide pyrophosphorylase [carboxylating] isoform X1 [Amblyraja radiata]
MRGMDWVQAFSCPERVNRGLKDKGLRLAMDHSPDPSHLLSPMALRRLARSCLLEDCPHFDWAGAVVGEGRRLATILLKSPGVLAGIPFAVAVFQELGLRANWLRTEGEWIGDPCPVAQIWGPARHLLLAERPVLNLLGRAGAIASVCRRATERASSLGWRGALAGTRKTAPGLRLLEKHAMAVGGAQPHRLGLGDLIMVKDNHLAVVGDVDKAVRDARAFAGIFCKVEVEVSSLEEARQAARARADIVMLDNLTPQGVRETARALKEEFPTLLIEASGGITEETLPLYLCPFVDVISLGSFTQNFTALDFSMRIEPEIGGEPEPDSGIPSD